MKVKALLLFALMIVSGIMITTVLPAHAPGITFIGGNDNFHTGTSYTLSYSGSSGDTFFLSLSAWNCGGCTYSTPTDTGGDTFTKLVSKVANNVDGELWATAAGGSHASTSFTVTCSGCGTMGVAVTEYSGVTAFGTTNSGSAGGGINSYSITQSLTSANDYAMCGIGMDTGRIATATAGTLRQNGGDYVIAHDNTGSTSVTCSATLSANANNLVTLSVDSEAVPPTDYSLSASPSSFNVARGALDDHILTSTITVTNIFGNPNVTLTCTGLPSGITCNSFVPNIYAATYSSTLTFTVDHTVTAGSHTFNVQGSSAQCTCIHTTTITVIVSTFAYTLSPAFTLTTTTGTNVIVGTIIVKNTTVTAVPITLTCNAPSGITCEFLTPIGTPTFNSTLILHIAASFVQGTYAFNITGNPTGTNLGFVTITVVDSPNYNAALLIIGVAIVFVIIIAAFMLHTNKKRGLF